MKRYLLLCFFLHAPSIVFAQIVLTIEGTEVYDTTTGPSEGISIPRTQPTVFTFRNNSLTYVNNSGYILQAGDESPNITNNNLDGMTITGNRFTWNGKNETSSTHAVFTGYNLGVVIKYNYLDRTPNGIQRKSNGMTDQSGVIAYNIIKNPKVGIVVKGMNGVRIYNNTFFSESTPEQTLRGLIDIHTNFDGGLSAVSAGTKIFNNIFYTRFRTLNIKIYETGCLTGFESDYNLFWCESGGPIFEVNNEKLSFAQWQEMGYDKHSIVVNPEFMDFTDFIPQSSLEYGRNLGADFQSGLSTNAVWGKADPELIIQGLKWQVGARIHISPGPDTKISVHPNPVSDVLYVSINDENLTYDILKIYDLQGKILYHYHIVQGPNIINIPRYFTSGIYNIALESDDLKRYIKKIAIVR